MKNPPRNKDAESSRLKARGSRQEPSAFSLQPRARPAPSPQQGFSLIELLIASVIVASAGALLIGGLVAANRSADLRIDQTLSTQLLASQLALLDDQIDPNTSTSGTFPSPLDAFAWTLEWTDAPLTPLAQTTLTVTTKSRAAHVVTYRSVVQP